MNIAIKDLVVAGHQLSKRLGEPDATIVSQLATQLDIQVSLVKKHTIPPAPVVSFYCNGIEAAAAWVDQQRESYDSEHGQQDPDTGSFEFSNDAQRDYSCTLVEIAEGIRALHPGAKPVPVVHDERGTFEEFIAERFGDTIDQRRAKNGDQGYMAWDMVVAWIVWQRRAKMQGTAPRVNADERQAFENWLATDYSPDRSGETSEADEKAFLAVLFYVWEARAAISNSPVIPDGYCIMPVALTAENGAKRALSGEFSTTRSVTCPECGGDGCSDCDGRGDWNEDQIIDWTTIKEIYRRAVEICSRPTEQLQDKTE